MNKKPYRRLKHFPRSRSRSRLSSVGIAAILVPAFFLASCTVYRPLDQGATVPWAKALAATRGGPIDANRYRVGQGDALSQIAERYEVRLSNLAAANNIQAPYILYPGEVIRIPADAPMPARRPEAAPIPRIVQTALPSADLPKPTSEAVWKRKAVSVPDAENDTRAYVVAHGENLSGIAYQHGLSLSELVAANDIEPPYRIEPGQTLLVPLTEAERRQKIDSNRQASSEAAVAGAPPPPLSAEGFLWPVEGELIGSFEQNSKKGRSGGITIAARKGTPVRAADSGIVAYAGEALSGYGRMVMLRHAEGYVTLYAHNDVMLVREGDVVRRGQLIAEVGDSGDVGESQLHFELRKGTAPIDPAKVLAGLPGRQIGQL